MSFNWMRKERTRRRRRKMREFLFIPFIQPKIINNEIRRCFSLRYLTICSRTDFVFLRVNQNTFPSGLSHIWQSHTLVNKRKEIKVESTSMRTLIFVVNFLFVKEQMKRIRKRLCLLINKWNFSFSLSLSSPLFS